MLYTGMIRRITRQKKLMSCLKHMSKTLNFFHFAFIHIYSILFRHYRIAKQAGLDKRNHLISQIEESYTQELRSLEESYKKSLDALLARSSSTSKTTSFAKAVSEGSVRSECQICYDGLESVVLEPCGHFVCQSCCRRLKAADTSLQRCPWDRQEITSFTET